MLTLPVEAKSFGEAMTNSGFKKLHGDFEIVTSLLDMAPPETSTNQIDGTLALPTVLTIPGPPTSIIIKTGVVPT